MMRLLGDFLSKKTVKSPMILILACIFLSYIVVPHVQALNPTELHFYFSGNSEQVRTMTVGTGQAFTIGGYLTDCASLCVGVSGKDILLYKSNDGVSWSYLATTTTFNYLGVDGLYSWTYQSSTAKTYYFKTVFSGDSTYAASESGVLEVIVAGGPPSPPVANFKSYSIEDVGGSAEARIEGNHAVGGLLEFDATDSKDPNGRPLTYHWNFGDGQTLTTTDPKYRKIYAFPEKFTVNLMVENDLGIKSDTFSEYLDLSLEPGDIFVIRSKNPYANFFDFFGLTMTHAGMYVGKINGEYKVVETTISRPIPTATTGVQETPLWRWGYNSETYVDIVRITTDDETKARAVAFARGLVLDPTYHAYDKQVWGKQLDCTFNEQGCDKYYCSELVWAAYYKGSNGVIDLAWKPANPLVAVSPDDILYYPHSTIIGSHHEKYPPKTHPLSITSTCPVDISVMNPSGSIITKQSFDSSGEFYIESDLDGDLDLDDRIFIDNPINGDYLISIIPEQMAGPTDTFTLFVNVSGKSVILAKDVMIKDIPNIPYHFMYKNLVPLPGCTNPPTDPDYDSIYEDLNGNGRLDFADVVLYFNQMTWIAANEPIPAFDLNGNGRIDFADIVALFNEI